MNVADGPRTRDPANTPESDGLSEGVDEKTSEADYQRRYYLANREKLLARRRKQYQSDPEYRELVMRRARERERAIREARRMNRGGFKKRSANKPRVMIIGGNPTMLYGVSEFAKRLGYNVQTVTQWEAMGVIPRPTARDEFRRRWYSEAHMDLIASVVRDFHEQGGRRRADLKVLIWEEWRRVEGLQ